MLTQMFSTIVEESFTISLVIALVMVARFLLRKSPKVFSYALWGVVLFRLICPVTLESEYGLIPSTTNTRVEGNFVEVEAPPSYESFAPVEVVAPAPIEGDTLSSSEWVTPVEDIAPVDVVQPAPARVEEKTPIDWYSIVGYIWLIGVVFMLGYGVREFVVLNQSLVGATRWKDCSYGDNIYLCDYIKSPFVMGILKPKIYIPSNLIGRDLDYIISHEKHHLKRLDHLTRVAGFLALSVHWFNPLVWSAFVLSGKDMELSCDEYVLGSSDSSDSSSVDIRAEYSQALLYFACNLDCRRKLIAITPHAFGESGSTKERIVNIMTYKKTAVWVTVLLAGLVGLTSVALASDKTPVEDIPTTTTTEEVVEAQGEVEVDSIVQEIVTMQEPKVNNILIDNTHNIVNQSYGEYFMYLFSISEQVDIKPELREEIGGRSSDETHIFDLTFADGTTRVFELSGSTIAEFIDDSEYYYTIQDVALPYWYISEVFSDTGELRQSSHFGNPLSNQSNEKIENVASIRLTYDDNFYYGLSNDDYTSKVGSYYSNATSMFENSNEIVIVNQDYINFITDAIYNSKLITNTFNRSQSGLDFEIEFTFEDDTTFSSLMYNGLFDNYSYRYFDTNSYQFFEDLMSNGTVNGLGDPTTKNDNNSNSYQPTKVTQTNLENVKITLVDENNTLIKNANVRIVPKFDYNTPYLMSYVTDNNGVVQGLSSITSGYYEIGVDLLGPMGENYVYDAFNIALIDSDNLVVEIPATYYNDGYFYSTYDTKGNPTNIYLKDEQGNPIVNAFVQLKRANDDASITNPRRVEYPDPLTTFVYSNDEGRATFASVYGDYIVECVIDGEVVLIEEFTSYNKSQDLEFTV